MVSPSINHALFQNDDDASTSCSSSCEDDFPEDVPEEYICPITLCVMKDPVVSKSGKNFDREAILKWLAKGNENCPLTRKPLHLSSLVPNNNLRKSIQEWKQEQGLSETTKSLSFYMPTHKLASLGLVMEFSNDMIIRQQARREQQQQQHQQQESALSPSRNGLTDLVAMYDEVLALTDEPAGSSSYIRNNSTGNEDLESIVDAELQDIKEMYDELVVSWQATGTSW